MARAAVLGRLTWLVATVADARVEAPHARTLVLDVPGWPGHLAGQHVDVRLTAPDGYSTQRSYSIASAPDGERVELTVEVVPDGEVSPYLAEVLEVGDQIELRGPIGGWFVWHPDSTQPVLLVAGGSGVVPLMAMIRARAALGSVAPFRLVYSVRDPSAAWYGAELSACGVDISYVHTRAAPPGFGRPASRLAASDLVWSAAGGEPAVFVCGPTGFVEAAANLLVSAGHDARLIKTERFGPSGGR
jgi:ferredoxin-NADP reductase